MRPGLRRYPSAGLDQYVNDMIEELSLTEYADRPCGGYSGGNKRKLCVGIAMVGNPKVVFLDEPSTGMHAQTECSA